MPLPEYPLGVFLGSGYNGNSTYHSLQMKIEKRFGHGGTLLAAYTHSKLIADVSSPHQLAGWQRRRLFGEYGIQDPNNLRAEKALAGFDSDNRLVLSIRSISRSARARNSLAAPAPWSRKSSAAGA